MTGAAERPPPPTGRLLRASALLSIGQVLGQVAALGRTAIIARLISVSHMGIARSFGLTTMLLEMATYLAPESMMIQASDGDHPRLQRVAHLIQAIRGLVMGLLVFTVARPITLLFDIQDAVWAFQLLGLVPVIEGFVHLDLKRLQREFNYTPAVVVDSGSQILIMILAWPLGVWLRDYSVVLWLLLVKAVAQVVGSHLLARRPYRFAFDRAYLRRFLHFGWPLLINGLLICLIQQGDHLILGAGYGMAVLGVYANAYLLAMLPTKVLSNVGRSITLPLLSSSKDQTSLYQERYRRIIQIVSLLSMGLGVTFIILGGRFVVLVFGPQYASAASYIGWLAGLASLRLIRTAPTQAAMARADTLNSMYANLASSIGLVGMVASSLTGQSISWIAFFAFVGEVSAVSCGLIRLRLKQGIPLSVSLRAISIPALALLTAVAAAHSGLASDWVSCIALTALIGLVYVAIGLRAYGVNRELLEEMRVGTSAIADREDA